MVKNDRLGGATARQRGLLERRLLLAACSPRPEDPLSHGACFQQQDCCHEAGPKTPVSLSLQLTVRWQLCHLVQFSIEEAISSPELPLRVVRKRQTDAPEAERFDLDDDFQGVDEGEDGN